MFADATGDHQWIHLDQERAAAGPFGGTIAHGFLTLSLGPMLVHEVFEVADARMSINYGLNRVRFPARSRSAAASAPTSRAPRSRRCPAGCRPPSR